MMRLWRTFLRLRKVALGVAAFALGFAWIPFSAWTSVSQELAIFFGLLAAALPAAMALTAQVSPHSSLGVPESEALAHRLERQQTYWFALLILCGLGIVALVVGKMLSDPAMHGAGIVVALSKAAWLSGGMPDVSLAPVFSGAMTAIFSLLAVHIIGLGRGVASLQRLRTQLIRDAARKEAERVAEAETAGAPPYTPDPKFGEVVKAPKPRPRKTAA